MRAFTGFVEVTGECLASCGGDSIDGHTDDCELLQAIDELEAMRKLLVRAQTALLTDPNQKESQEYRAAVLREMSIALKASKA